MKCPKKNIPADSSDSGSEILPGTLLAEVSWEVCRQVGGIYTVIRSKIPAMMEKWGARYCLVGPYDPNSSPGEFEPGPEDDLFGEAAVKMRENGMDVHCGRWLVTGRPRVVLMNLDSVRNRMAEIKYFLWENHKITAPAFDAEFDDVLAFGFMTREFFLALAGLRRPAVPVIGHFHEWLAGAAIPDLRRAGSPTGIVFTTHATLLGRYLASNDYWFYDHLPFVDWEADARRFNIEARVKIERAAAHGAHVLTTVSDVTALECKHLLGREADFALPNGLNIERFKAVHESENLHHAYKQRIHQMVIGHFFPSYSFDLDRTLYFFTSGRYEYRNKGFDLSLDALARLNWRLKQAGTDTTVVMFIISRRPFRAINPDVMHNRATLDEINRNCITIKDKLGERLFHCAAKGALPDMNDLLDDYWRLRLARTIQAWRTKKLPYVVTHDMWDNDNDEVLNQLRAVNLVNKPDDPVKVVYHPDFITPVNPLFGMEYDQFVRGCHIGLFPSFYEPWGYTPLECIARGIMAVTSDLSGFGSYILKRFPDCEKRGLLVVRRKYREFPEAAEELAGKLFEFTRLDLRPRISLRLRAQELAEGFDWHYLAKHYDEAHILSFYRIGT